MHNKTIHVLQIKQERERVTLTDSFWDSRAVSMWRASNFTAVWRTAKSLARQVTWIALKIVDQINLGMVKQEIQKCLRKIFWHANHTMLVIPCSFSTLMLSTLSLWTSNCIRLMASSMHFEPTNNITNKTIWEIKHSNHIKHQWTKQIRYIFHKFMTPEIAIHEPTVLNAKD